MEAIRFVMNSEQHMEFRQAGKRGKVYAVNFLQQLYPTVRRSALNIYVRNMTFLLVLWVCFYDNVMATTVSTSTI